MKTELKELSIKDIAMIKSLFTAVFTKEPWNDDWSDEEQGRGLGTQFLAQADRTICENKRNEAHLFADGEKYACV